MPSTKLSLSNAATTFTSWKRDLVKLLDSKPMPKNFYETKTGSKESFVEHAIISLSDLLMTDIPSPELSAYSEKKEYMMAVQKFKQVCAEVDILMKESLSEDLYKVYSGEKCPSAGFNSILVEVKFDKLSQVNIQRRKLEQIKQSPTQSVKDYADYVNLIILELASLDYPSANLSDQFELDLAERFVDGMVLESAHRFRPLFKSESITTFAKMRLKINDEYAQDQKAKAQRQEEQSDDISNVGAYLANQKDFDAKIYNLIKKALKETSFEKFEKTYHDSETEVFVGRLSPEATEQALQDAFKSFGEIVSVKVLKHPTGESKRCAFVRFKSPHAAKAAINKGGEVSIMGTLVVVEKVKPKSQQIKPKSSAYLSVPFSKSGTMSDSTSLSGVVDSGCTPHHLTPSADPLQDTRATEKFSLGVADGKSLASSGTKGNFHGKDAFGNQFGVKDVMVVPGLATTLFSTYAFMKENLDVWFDHKTMSVNIGNLIVDEESKVLAKGTLQNGLFSLNLTNDKTSMPPLSSFLAASSPSKKTFDLFFFLVNP
jgi:RNA recognition motif-containing protein